jgi:hypothetical protein
MVYKMLAVHKNNGDLSSWALNCQGIRAIRPALSFDKPLMQHWDDHEDIPIALTPTQNSFSNNSIFLK